jgi:hypothetical protein
MKGRRACCARLSDLMIAAGKSGKKWSLPKFSSRTTQQGSADCFESPGYGIDLREKGHPRRRG